MSEAELRTVEPPVEADLPDFVHRHLKSTGMKCDHGHRRGLGPARSAELPYGQRAITGDTALRLGHFFGTSPEFWLNLQSLYELCLAEQRAGETTRSF